MSAVLVVTAADDRSGAAVLDELRARGQVAHRLDLSDFPAQVRFAATINGTNGWKGEITHQDGWRVLLQEVMAVYYRRPTDFKTHPKLPAGERRFVAAESRLGFGGVLAALDARFVNHPFRIADAEFKPLQLRVAVECGLSCPPTLVTNDGEQAVSFVRGLGGLEPKVIYKPMSSGFVRDDDNSLRQIFSTPVQIARTDVAAIAATAHTLQRRIDKTFDVRVTSIGHEHFATAIHADSTAGRIDWRSDYGGLDFESVELPTDVSSALDRYLARMGLAYGASDFALDKSGRWWFLECNPNGQWGFIAEATEQPIASTIASLLITGAPA